ncbi:MAG TPA: hypothetical protein VLH56_19060 [Dissulfurispiraceae bacterium]|nr:hypothetical protein [Dissulfurispiraceae bacterium]
MNEEDALEVIQDTTDKRDTLRREPERVMARAKKAENERSRLEHWHSRARRLNRDIEEYLARIEALETEIDRLEPVLAALDKEAEDAE